MLSRLFDLRGANKKPGYEQAFQKTRYYIVGFRRDGTGADTETAIRAFQQVLDDVAAERQKWGYLSPAKLLHPSDITVQPQKSNKDKEASWSKSADWAPSASCRAAQRPRF